MIRRGSVTSNIITLSTGDLQGCVFSPLLYTPLTHDCTATHDPNHIIKFTDDTTVLGLTSRDDETAYREEVEWLSTWCTDNQPLNDDNTKEITGDFRKTYPAHIPPNINGSAEETVKFLSVHITEELT